MKHFSIWRSSMLNDMLNTSADVATLADVAALADVADGWLYRGCFIPANQTTKAIIVVYHAQRRLQKANLYCAISTDSYKVCY